MTGHLTNNKSWLNWPIRSINIQRLILSTIPDHFESEYEYCTGFWMSTTALFNMCSPGQSYSTHLCNSSKKICFERRSKSLFRKLLLACTLNLHALLFAKISMKTLRLRRERTRLSLLLVSFVCEVDTVLYIYSLPTDLWSFSFFKEIWFCLN